MVPTITLNNGLKIPALGLGTWCTPPGLVGEAVKTAIDIGYRHIDCAHVYGNEKEIGDAIKEKIEEGAVTREDLWITSKLWNTHHRPEVVEKALRTTLENLGLEYLDLYLIHWPFPYKEGDNVYPLKEEGNFDTIIFGKVPYEDTYKAMENLVAQRLTRSIGLSNFNSEQILKILDVAVIKPVTNQVECHPYLNQRKLAGFCIKHGIYLTGYSPLGSPGSIFVAPDSHKIMSDPDLFALADKYNKTVAQLLIRYQIQMGNITIPKTVSEDRLRENFDIFDFEISEEDMQYLYSFNRNFRTCDFHADHPYYPFKIPY